MKCNCELIFILVLLTTVFLGVVKIRGAWIPMDPVHGSQRGSTGHGGSPIGPGARGLYFPFDSFVLSWILQSKRKFLFKMISKIRIWISLPPAPKKPNKPN